MAFALGYTRALLQAAGVWSIPRQTRFNQETDP